MTVTNHRTCFISSLKLAFFLMVMVAAVGCSGSTELVEPPPAPSDPVLKIGYAVFRERCVSCHGLAGKGDGPMSKGLSGPPPGDLTDQEWKHGSHPEEVLTVLRQGAPGATMPAFGKAITDKQLLAVAAYVYHLAGQEVPAELKAN